MDLTNSELWGAMAFWLVMAAVLASLLLTVGRRALSEHTLQAAPSRLGQLMWADLLIGLGLWIVSTMIAAAVAARFTDTLDEQTQLVATGVAGTAGSLLTLAYIFARAHLALPRGVRQFGLRPWPRSDNWAVLGATLVAIFGTYIMLALVNIIARLFGHSPPAIQHGLLQVIAESNQPAIVWTLIGLAVVAAPIIEEIIFRGLVQTVLVNQLPHVRRWVLILVASVLFAVVHVSIAPLALPGYIVLAVALGYIYERTASLGPPILIHALFNGLNVLAAMYLIPAGSG